MGESTLDPGRRMSDGRLPILEHFTNRLLAYRIHLYKTLHEELSKAGSTLRVHTLVSADDRDSAMHAADGYPFPCCVHPSRLPFRSSRLHFDPFLVRRMRGGEQSWHWLGGFYNLTLVAMGYSRRQAGQKRLLWLEARAESCSSEGALERRIKAGVVRRCDAVVVPGVRSVRYVVSLAGEAYVRRCIALPNVVDEAVFCEGVRAARTQAQQVRTALGISPNQRMVLSVARLVKIKGHEHVLLAVDRDLLRNAVLVFAGTGPGREHLEAVARSRGLTEHVRFLGHCSEARLVGLYAAADMFLHASFLDRAPLAVTESLFAGLPLLLCERVGSYPEMLEEGVNGLGFDVLRPDSVAEALRQMLALPWDALRHMGDMSLQRAQSRLLTNAVVARFIQNLLELREAEL